MRSLDALCRLRDVGEAVSGRFRLRQKVWKRERCLKSATWKRKRVEPEHYSLSCICDAAIDTTIDSGNVEICRDDRCPILGIHPPHPIFSGRGRIPKKCPKCRRPIPAARGAWCRCGWDRRLCEAPPKPKATRRLCEALPKPKATRRPCEALKVKAKTKKVRIKRKKRQKTKKRRRRG